MAREILFRGKTRDEKEWIEGFYAVFSNTPFIGAPNRYGTMLWQSVISKTVGQFTGLNDKNGKKVFEGDILSTENGTFSNTGMGYILFYKGMWTSFYGQDGIGRDCFDELHTVCNSREVIGNIYDNPELLYDEES